VAEGRQAETARWTVRNEFGRQRPRIRIEALRTTAGYDSNGAVLLTDFSRPDAFLSPVSLKHHLVPDYGGASPGVIQRLERSAAMVKAGDASGSYSATNSDKTQRGWSRMGLRFPAPLDLRGRQAIGVWVYGDGKGEVLNFQLSAREMQGLVDRYVVVDFQGWRCFELIEAEGDRYYDYTWPYVDRRVIGLPVPYERIGWLNILYTNIPPGQTVTCLLSPIKALPTLIAALSNPALTINGRRVVFPVELHSGEYLELEDPGPVQVRDANGNVLRQVELRGELAELSSGDNQVRFDCEPLDSLAPRVHVTVAAVGRPLN
jgi:hypothetical protein